MFPVYTDLERVVENRRRSAGNLLHTNKNRANQRFSRSKKTINRKGPTMAIADGVAECIRTIDRNEEISSVAFNGAVTSTKEKIM